MSVSVTTLDNGIRVVTHEMPHLETVSLGVWISAGSRHERADQHGISHMLEHMAFKGTTSRSARDIAYEVEAVGGDINAATSFESTAYTVRVMKNDVPLGMNILGDILSNPRFADEEISREHGVIIQEIGAARDIPDDLVFDMFQEAAFPDQPLGRPILGTPETVRSFGAADLRDYMGEHYLGGSTVISAAGAIVHSELVELAKRNFAGFKASKKADPVGQSKAAYKGGEALHARDLEQTHILIGFKGMPYSDDDFYATQVLSGILGGGMSSRLFQEVREKRGLCYSVYAFHWAFHDAGLFGVYAATGNDQLAELTPVLCQELRRTMSDITAEEVARVRAQVRTGIALSLESSGTRAGQIARQIMLFDRIIPVQEIVDKIEKIDEEQVMAVARRLFANEELTLAVIGDLSGVESCAKIKDRLVG